MSYFTHFSFLLISPFKSNQLRRKVVKTPFFYLASDLPRPNLETKTTFPSTLSSVGSKPPETYHSSAANVQNLCITIYDLSLMPPRPLKPVASFLLVLKPNRLKFQFPFLLYLSKHALLPTYPLLIQLPSTLHLKPLSS